jgi:hypothetical protein
MEPIVSPRPEASPCCHQMTRPQIRCTKTDTKLISEAHYVCPRCTRRFKIGILPEQDL